MVLGFVHPSAAVAAPRSGNAFTRTYIASVAPLAQREMREHGVPASVAIAQSVLESNWGRSTLSTNQHNYFGIKCSRRTSPLQFGCVQSQTLEYLSGERPTRVKASFRTYRSVSDSFLDHGLFLRTHQRYAGAFRHTGDPDAFVRAVARAGYATDPQYAATVTRLMREHDLYRFDRGADAGQVKVQGAIGREYADTGGERGPLGRAIGAESDGPVPGSRMVRFDNGVIIWSRRTGAAALYGAIWQRYRSDVQLRERLGLPTRSEYAVKGGRESRFQHGHLTFAAKSRTVSVRVR